MNERAAVAIALICIKLQHLQDEFRDRLPPEDNDHGSGPNHLLVLVGSDRLTMADVGCYPLIN